MLLASSVDVSTIAGQSVVASVLVVVGGGMGKLLLREKDKQIADRDKIISEKDEQLEAKSAEVIELRKSAQSGIDSLGKVGDVMNQALGLLVAQSEDVRDLLDDRPKRAPTGRTTPKKRTSR